MMIPLKLYKDVLKLINIDKYCNITIIYWLIINIISIRLRFA